MLPPRKKTPIARSMVSEILLCADKLPPCNVVDLENIARNKIILLSSRQTENHLDSIETIVGGNPTVPESNHSTMDPVKFLTPALTWWKEVFSAGLTKKGRQNGGPFCLITKIPESGFRRGG
jgi:hypothetical protein